MERFHQIYLPIFPAIQSRLTSSFTRIRPSSGRDMDQRFLQSSYMMMLNMADNICYHGNSVYISITMVTVPLEKFPGDNQAL